VLWTRFRKACDAFFTAKKEFFKDARKHEMENLQKKEELIKRVNEYVFDLPREECLEVLKEFQREWTLIGYTAVSEKERLWSEFRAAIDKRFEELKSRPVGELNKEKYTEHISGMLDSNAKKSNEAIEKEQRAIQYKIKQLTDDVNLWENNLGFFSNSKNSEELKAQFSKRIEQARQEIETLQAKLTIIKASKESVRESKKSFDTQKSEKKENKSNKKNKKKKPKVKE